MSSNPLHNAGGWLARRVDRTGSRTALVELEAGSGDAIRRRLDSRELEARTARMAGWLRARGIGRGDRVALLVGNRSAFVESVFAAARVGAMALPINTRLAAPEVHELLADSAPALLVHDVELALDLDAACAGLPARPERLAVGGARDAYEEALASAPPLEAAVAVAPDDPMLLMYTSGTTGRPKGALLPHRKALFNSLNAQIFFDLSSRDRVLVSIPLFHSFGLQILAIPALYAGASVWLAPRFEAEHFWNRIAASGITYAGVVPAMLPALRDRLDLARARPDGGLDLSSLRFLFAAGAATPAATIEAFHERGVLIQQGYGQTETSVLCCLDPCDALRKAGSVGRPVFHVELRIVDCASIEGPVATWRDVQPGERGEIAVRGPITMTGYWAQPNATRATLREDGWLRTGDLAVRDPEGFVSLVGRARDLYISGGENVYPAQVELTYAAHPSIREIAVVGVPDTRWGEVGRAFLVLEPGAELDPRALAAWGRERLASFKVPRDFVAVPELPKTASGKIQKHRLPRDSA